MSLDWILNPITQYSLLALGFMSCMGLCFATSIGMRAERRRMAQLQGSVDESVVALCTTVDQFRRDGPEPETRGPAPLDGLNLTKRAQVLRMHRRGDPPERIASLLEVPRQEVDLLIKVHRIIISQL